MRLARALAVLLLLATAPALRAQSVLLRVGKDPGGIRLTWTGGAPDFDAYISSDPRRVVSPARVLGTTSSSDLFRATPVPDQRVLFLQVGCAGAGCEERCYGGADDDGDTLADCADPDCAGSPDCVPETLCANGLDDDGDDLLDCDDPDCQACDDGDACTADACDPAEPTGCRHDAIACNDNDECTTDTCDPATGCVFTPRACSDGNACNGVETCDPATGNCLPGTPPACDDGDPCNGVETCDFATGNCVPGTPPPCDDADACNGLETCNPADGQCLPGTPVTCGDGDACNGVETCDPATGACLPGTPVTCDDGDACNGVETCVPATGACLPGTPVTCDDGDACNGVETCDPATGGCLPGAPVTCDDGNACNGLETCDPATGTCLPGVPVTCSDGDACTDDACNPADGTCSFPVRACDDRDACTTDGCNPATGCTTVAVRCDDGDACTDDTCDPASGCLFPPRDCNDGNDCTIDACDPALGCTHAPDPAATIAQPAQLAGRSLAQYPWFAHVSAFNVNAPVELGLDTTRMPELAGRTCDVYVVTSRTDAEWCAQPNLTDVRGAHDTRTFAAGGTQANRFPLIAANQLSAAAGAGFGAGYDVVLDCDRDGQLDATDKLDGLGDESGLYLVHDLTQAGPFATNSFDQIGPLPPWPGPWSPEGDDLRVYYPAVLDDPAYVGTFPLIVVSHGNGHSFAWYVFLQQYLASYGYIVAAHDNNTFFGIEQASSSTLYWTNKVIADQPTEGGGVLNGHIDDSRIGWIGHSRGGEGVVRAYDRMHDEGFTPAQFSLGDVRLVVSLAPTDFLGGNQSDPHDVPYTLLYGAADGDVSGCPAGAQPDVPTSFNIYERGTGEKSVTYVHGASHSDFHDCGVGGDTLADGPDRPGCENVHLVEKPAILALVERFVDSAGNVPSKDFLWRHYEDIKPIGAPATMTVDREYDPGAAAGARVIDDFESQPSTATSSCGGNVTFSVQGVTEGKMDDADASFDWSVSDPWNGMTRNAGSPDDSRGVTFFWSAGAAYELAVPPGLTDLTGFEWLSVRGCQITRAPETTAQLADLVLTVKLFDGSGRSSAIRIDAYSAGLEEPYQRTGCPTGGTAAGWQDEFEVLRIRLDDFRNEGSGLDLTDVRAVRFEFGGTAGAAQGRIALDDVEFQR